MSPSDSQPADPLVTSDRDRVNKALRFEKPDRTPRDFAAVSEVWHSLGEHFGTHDRGQILTCLGVDCRTVSYDSFCHHPAYPAERINMDASLERSSVEGMWRLVEPDGSNRDIWGAHRRRVPHAFGWLEQFASYPLAGASNLDDLRGYRWPEPDWWDFSALRDAIRRLNQRGVHHIRYRVGSVFETAWSLYGIERFLMKLAAEPEEPVYVMERIAEVHIENSRRVLEIAGDLIDIVYFYDDLATQNGLLISPKLYERYIQPFHAQLIALARKFGEPAMMHSCGSVYALIPRLIDMGLSVLNPVQPGAKDMDAVKLAREFGGRIVFHGGVDVQHLLPTATPDEVRQEVSRISEVLGRCGGYIRAGSHHIQADTPVANVLAMYSVD